MTNAPPPHPGYGPDPFWRARLLARQILEIYASGAVAEVGTETLLSDSHFEAWAEDVWAAVHAAERALTERLRHAHSG